MQKDLDLGLTFIKEGMRLHQKGDLSGAEMMYMKAIRSGLENWVVYSNLGSIHRGRGKLTAARACLERALEICPEAHQAAIGLSNVFQDLGESQKSREYAMHAVNIAPNYAKSYTSLSVAEFNLGSYRKSIKYAKQALRLERESVEALLALARGQLMIGHIREASRSINKIIRSENAPAAAYYVKGRILAVDGSLKEALGCFRKAIQLSPDCFEAYYELSRNLSSREDAVQLLSSIKSIGNSAKCLSDKNYLWTGLSNCYHLLKDYENSSRALNLACRARIGNKTSDLPRYTVGDMDKLTDYQREKSMKKDKSRLDHIFIVGMPRSGSTLLEVILSLNEQTYSLGETDALKQTLKEFKSNQEQIKEQDSFTSTYLRKAEVACTSRVTTIDKNLYNLTLSKTIIECMPNSKIIHCTRSPLDIVLSVLRANMRPIYTSAAEDIARMLIHQEKYMRSLMKIYSEQIYTFNYEDTVTNPSRYLKNIIRWLDWKWDEKYLHPEKSRITVSNASTYQARKPITASSISAWKNYRDLLEPARILLLKSGIYPESLFE